MKRYCDMFSDALKLLSKKDIERLSEDNAMKYFKKFVKKSESNQNYKNFREENHCDWTGWNSCEDRCKERKPF
jgi:hypothetical protein